MGGLLEKKNDRLQSQAPEAGRQGSRCHGSSAGRPVAGGDWRPERLQVLLPGDGDVAQAPVHDSLRIALSSPDAVELADEVVRLGIAVQLPARPRRFGQ